MSSIEANKLYVGILSYKRKKIMICLLAHSVFFFFRYLPKKPYHGSCQQQRACVCHPQLVYKRNTCSVQQLNPK
jgi:hypothetical protein